MEQRLYRLGLVTATVFVSLTSTIKLPGTPFDWVLSAQAQTNQDRNNEALRLMKAAVGQFNAGKFREALQTLEQALVIVKEIGDSPNGDSFASRQIEGIIINNIGEIYRNIGQYPQALKYQQQALVIRREVGDKRGEGSSLNNIGLVYDNLGQYPQALQYFEQALVVQKEIGDKATQGSTLNNIGEVYRKLRQYPNALKYFEQSLIILKEIGNKNKEGRTLNNIGMVYDDLGKYPQALQYFEQALVIEREINDKAGEGTTLNNIGLVHNKLGQYPDALKYYFPALVISKEVGNKAMEGKTLNNIGVAYYNLRQYADAEKNLFAAIEVWESLRPGLTDASKISIFEIQAPSYRLLQQSLVAQNKTNIALEIAERGRARAFVELLAQRQSANPNNQLTVKPPTIEQIKLIAKIQNATLVQYSIVGNKALYIWVVKPTGEVAFKQVDLKSLKTPIAELVTISRDAMGVRGRGIGVLSRDDAPNQAEQLQQLHQILIQPISQFLPTDPNSKVIFIPQSSLFLVPFAALQDEQGKYLIEKHTILTAPAIQVLELTH
ncbi:MAG: tetratricopeptide repeat protein, partial [Coleofasciculaceae cyanobacterium]